MDLFNFGYVEQKRTLWNILMLNCKTCTCSQNLWGRGGSATIFSLKSFSVHSSGVL